MRWSKLKQVCKARMAPALAGRVELHATRYTGAGAHDQQGRGWITVDRVEVASFCDLATNVRYMQPQQAEPSASHDTRTARLQAEGVHSRLEFYGILQRWLDLPVAAILTSNNVLLRAMAMTDQRLGKRRLRRLQEQMADEHPLVQRLYTLRCEVENISPTPAPAINTGSPPQLVITQVRTDVKR